MAALDGQKTFLEMQTEVADEAAGVAVADLVRPTLTVLKRIINDCERDICSAWDWSWLYRESTFPTVANQETSYAVDPQAADVHWMSVPAQQARISWLSMANWEATYPGRYNSAGPCRPWAYIEAPPVTATNLGLRYFLFPAADAIYTVAYGFKLRVGNMTADADYSKIPVDWQGMLLNRAKAEVLKYLGISSTDPRITRYLQDAQAIYERAWIADQRMAESVQRFRDAYAERALGLGAPGNFANGAWISG